MPDLDIVAPIAPGWYRPYNLVRGGADAPAVAHGALAALTSTLRRGHGLLALDQLERLTASAVTGGLSGPDVLSRLHDIERDSGGDRHTKVAVRTVAGIIAGLGDEGCSVDRLRTLIATQFCTDLLAHQLYGPAWAEVLHERFSPPSRAEAFSASVAEILETPLVKLGADLARDPEARHIRAPVIPGVQRRPTAELLEESILVQDG
jgi:hypothetical protein